MGQTQEINLKKQKFFIAQAWDFQMLLALSGMFVYN